MLKNQPYRYKKTKKLRKNIFTMFKNYKVNIMRLHNGVNTALVIENTDCQ